MEKAYLQWNLVNWITVVLMAALGGVIVGAVAKVTGLSKGGNSDA